VTSQNEADLEIISKMPADGAEGVPIVFVHGAFGGAWCWDEYFLSWFAERGYAAYAVSLRGHGTSGGGGALGGAGIDDYVTDLLRVTGRFERPPILVGHSMGGFVVQKYLERGDAAGMALMAAVPPRGLVGPGLSLMVWQPTLALSIGAGQIFGESWDAPELMREALFSNSLPTDQADAYLARMGPESTRAMIEMAGLEPPRLKEKALPPVLVMGGHDDALIPPAFVRSTARAYGVSPNILEDIGHVMMLDVGWESVAQTVLDWMVDSGI